MIYSNYNVEDKLHGYPAVQNSRVEKSHLPAASSKSYDGLKVSTPVGSKSSCLSLVKFEIIQTQN